MKQVWFRLLLAFLVLVPLGLGAYKVLGLGVRVVDVMPRTSFRVSYAMTVDNEGSDVRVRTFLPSSDARQQISDEVSEGAGFHFSTELVEGNRIGAWSATAPVNNGKLGYTFSALMTPVEFRLAPDLPMPNSYPPSLQAELRPEQEIQVDAPEIRKVLTRIGAAEGSITTRLQRIFEFTSGLTQRPFKGTTDALTALRLGEASCNGKSRLFVALSRAAGIPARLVGGLLLESGSKRTSHQWVEVWVGGHWLPFCPTNHYFAALPEHYLKLYVGDEVLFSHTRDIDFDYVFQTVTSSVPSPAAKQWFPRLNVWALFERLGFSFGLLRTVLMLPVGALVVVLFRNVVGLPTFGTFLPALLAAAAGETGALWGVFGVSLVVGVVAVVRALFRNFQLLHSPMLAILLAAVTSALFTATMLAESYQLKELSHIALFPVAVLAITAERFYLSLADHGLRSAAKEYAGTIVVMLGCYAVMSSQTLHALLIGFPETLLLVVAAELYLGRWVGMRLSEYLRFHQFFARREVAR